MSEHSESDFTTLADLASRRLAATVVAANDELFAEREHLIRHEAATFAADSYGPKGKTYDGWETRRRREAGNDWAVVRLGAAGVVHGVVVDTAFFRGNYPPEVSIEAASFEGYPGAEQLAGDSWNTLVPRSPALGDTANSYVVDDPRRWTHVRLSIYPDGGVARLRVHGVVVPDPRFLEGTLDLAAAENGGSVVDCSNAFYSSPGNLILPGRARTQEDGWENARRRDGGNDHVTFALAAAGRIRHIELDTSCFIGNAPGWAQLRAIDARSAVLADSDGWWAVLPRVSVQPDTRHRFTVNSAREATHVRLDVFPDGGLARVRVYGELAEDALDAARRRWWDALPEAHRASIPDEAPAPRPDQRG